MAMARSSRVVGSILTRITAACSSHLATSSSSSSSSALSSHAERSSLLLLLPAAIPPPIVQPLSSAAPSWRSSIMSPFASPYGLAMSLLVRDSITPVTAYVPSSINLRCYSKRPKKWQGGPHAYIQVEPGAPCPPYSPNAGSVKKRKHNKRMAQRHAFAKAQAHERKEQTKAALIKRDAARRKRWREAAGRAKAWAKHLQEKQVTAVSA